MKIYGKGETRNGDDDEQEEEQNSTSTHLCSRTW